VEAFRVSLLVICAVSMCRASLIHEYTFANNFADSAGTVDGIAVNGAIADGGFLSLNGQGQYLQFSEQLVPTSGSYTVVMDVRATSVQTGYVELISQGFSMAPGFYLGQNPNGVIRVGDQFSDTGVLFPTNDGLWHQLLVQVDAVHDTSTLFVDGLKTSLGASLSTTPAGQYTRVGAQFYSYGEYYKGDIDNLRIFDEAVFPRDVSSASDAIANPEPATFVLIGLGAVALGVYRRAGKRSHSWPSQ
jgi:hypothetical protein